MRTRKSNEGYLLIDHRASPGLSPEFSRKFGMPYVAEGKLFESATMECSHCQRTVVLHPERERVRGHCWDCDKYVCDDCATLLKEGGCTNFNNGLDMLGNLLVRKS